MRKWGNCHGWKKNKKIISGGNAYQKPDSKMIVYHKKLDKNYTSQKL